MNEPASFGGGSFIADKSAWEWARRLPDPGEWTAALRNRQIRTCAIANLEILWSTRSLADFQEKEETLSVLQVVPITQSVCRAAIAAFRDLAATGHHRSVQIPDALIGAAAQDVGIGVLHYDSDYDRLATVLNFESRWIAPRGSL